MKKSTIRNKGVISLFDYNKQVSHILNKMKCKNIFDPLQCIPVYDPQLTIWAYLRPITKDYRLTLPGCAAILAKWRNENAHMSPGSFIATAESTEKWFDDLIIARNDRVLFLIIATDGTKVGHMGFSSFDYEKKSCEVDAVVRGVKDYPGMMTNAMNSLIYWGLTELKLQQILLRVLSDNLKAISFYSRNSFFKVKDIPLEPEKTKANQVAKKYYTQMQLDIKKWQAKNPHYSIPSERRRPGAR